MIFDDLTINQLRKLTEQYEKILKENKLLKAKFPTKQIKEEKKENSMQDLLDGLPQ